MTNRLSALTILLLTFTSCGGGGDDDDSSPAVNEAPSITSSALTSATEDIQYSYQVTATDDNSNVLTYSIAGEPSDMQMSSAGLITWTPTEGILTSGEVTVTVADSAESDALTVQQTFTIDVTPVNDSPSVESVDEVQTIDSGNLFSYQVQVVDVDDQNDGNNITFSLLDAPSGMEVSATGLLSWTPSVTSSADYSVRVQVSDGGEDNSTSANLDIDFSVLYYRQISGVIVNYFTGEGIESANVYISDGQAEIAETTTNALGEFTFSVVDYLITSEATISSFAQGFSEQAITIEVNETSLLQSIAAIPSHVVTSFDPSNANSIDLDGDVLVSFTENSLARDDGQPIVGNVTAQVTVIDPTVDISIMPGEMLTMVDGAEAPIESFGALNVVLSDESGASINVAEQAQSEIRIPIAGNSSSTPETIPLYYYDNVTGVWIEEGQATKVLDNGSYFYVGNVDHFTTWNADKVYETIFIDGCVVDASGEPASNVRVRSVGSDYNGSSSALTDSEGNFSIPVRQDSTVLLTGSQGAQSRTLTLSTSTENIVLTDCIELSAATSTIKLTWGENPSDLDTHFYGPADETGDEFHVYYGDKTVVVGNEEIYLDVDDTSSYGPEILTIPNFPFAGRYQYLVYLFSGSSDIQASPARVELNLESTINIFSPPSGTPTSYWHVFDIVVDEQGGITVERVDAWASGFSDRSQEQLLPESRMQGIKMPAAKKAIEDKYYAQ